MLIPAFFTFTGVLYESKFNNSIDEFFERELVGLKNKDYLKLNSKVNYNIDNDGLLYPWRDKTSSVIFNSYGLEPISNDIISLLKTKIKSYPHLSLTTIQFNQQEVENDFKEQKKFLAELRTRDSLELSDKTKQIQLLEEKLSSLERIQSINELYKTLMDDIKFNYDQVEEISIQNLIGSIDERDPVFLIKWNDTLIEDEIIRQQQKIKEWLTIKLESQSFFIKRFK